MHLEMGVPGEAAWAGGPGGAAPREEEKGGSGGQRPPGIILVFRMIFILVGATACARPSARPTVRPSDRPPVRPSDRPTVRPYIQNSHIYKYGHNCVPKLVSRHYSGGIRKEIWWEKRWDTSRDLQTSYVWNLSILGVDGWHKNTKMVITQVI